ncbi:MobF family relaxase [Phycicoccus sp.]|uniref:MobF family relaxase n=1 Tax=Phycicoccus sp. TaxID=1902410 RepID=UPI002C46CC6A|nr:MobF family relaxase [Phycicoccus sp.]HMM95054.1 MobF family relaxase [Phycicoccus sp.]
MTLHKLAAGSGYTYLTQQVAAHDATERGQLGLAAYYEEKGESPGRWMGSGLAGLDLADGDVVTEEQMKLLFGQGWHPRSQEPDAVARGWGALGRPFPTFEATTLRQEIATAFSAHNTWGGRAWNAPIPIEERALIRTDVITNAFARKHGRAPHDDTELTGFVASASKPAQTPVAGYDLTFSPVKSVSALWALAAPEVAREVEAAHEAAVRATIGLLEREVAFTRVGKGGIRQVPVTGLVAAAFDHRDSRAGDPDLHTHVVISNKVQTLPDEGAKWLTLDGRMVFKAKVMASEHYNTRLEAELTERLGVRFTERPSSQGRRPVREIEGIDTRLLEQWSSRRSDITRRQHQLAASFQADHGRAPTRIESLALAQQANLETRPNKHEPRSLREQREEWRTQADAVLGAGDNARSSAVTAVLATVIGRDVDGGLKGGRDETAEELARRVVDVLESSRSTWQVWHVQAEALRQARYAGIPLPSLDETVRDVVDRVTQGLSLPEGAGRDLGEPEFLRRLDGASVYTVHGSRTYTSASILEAERRLLEAAERTNGYVIPEFFVDLAVRRGAAASAGLDTGQAELVSALATSGARVQVALAPAGSGKTTAMATLAMAWRSGGGNVIGLAPTAVAADELGEAITTLAETVAKFLHTAAAAVSDGRVAAFPHIGPRTLVVIDEAGMVGTKDLAAVVDRVLEGGGSVRLVGDDQQLTAVAASGVFRDLAEQGSALGTTVRLTELHRFSDAEEAAATLGIRSGDSAALEHYLSKGRVHVGGAGAAVDQAFQAWRADLAAGRSSLLLAASRDTVRGLNELARGDRLGAWPVRPGREVVFADGTRARAGDVVITRHNDRSLRGRDGSWVKNGDRWVVRGIDRNGDLHVARAGQQVRRLGPTLRLPADYVVQHVQLGYASTIHGAQGATVDTTHTVVTGAESRQGLYVALSRGRHENHLYLSDDEPAPDGFALELPVDHGPREVLTRILERDDRAESATRAMAADPARELGRAIQQYEDALPLLAEHLLGDSKIRALDAALERWMPDLTNQPGYVALRGQIALRWVDGESPGEVVDQAAWWLNEGELDAAEDPAAALAQHVARSGPPPTWVGIRSWLPATPDSLREHPKCGPYLNRIISVINELEVAVDQRAEPPAELDRRLRAGQYDQDRARPPARYRPAIQSASR